MGSHRAPGWRASRSLETKPLGARFVTSPLLTFGDRFSLSRGLLEASWLLSSIPGLYPLEASSTHPPSREDQECLRQCHVLLGGQSAPGSAVGCR